LTLHRNGTIGGGKKERLPPTSRESTEQELKCRSEKGQEGRNKPEDRGKTAAGKNGSEIISKEGGKLGKVFSGSSNKEGVMYGPKVGRRGRGVTS